jgi:glutamate--cysteine ligase catalytic subunit
MGFLGTGAPLTWSDTKEYHEILDYVREHGVTQFMAVWTRVKDRRNDILLWGDEVEFHLARRSSVDGNLKLSLRAHEVIQKLDAEDQLLPEDQRACTWHPEYGAWMIEATPARHVSE